NGNVQILYCNAYNTADPTAVSSTNTTWTKVTNTGPDAGNAYHSLWIGKVSGGAGGTTVTITHTNSNLSIAALEVKGVTLTPTLGANSKGNIGTGKQVKDLHGIGAGHFYVMLSGPSNTGNPQRIEPFQPCAG